MRNNRTRKFKKLNCSPKSEFKFTCLNNKTLLKMRNVQAIRNHIIELIVIIVNSNKGKSCGVEMMSISFIPENINVDSG